MPRRPPPNRPPGFKPWEERREQYERSRPNASDRGYDEAWRRTRAAHLERFPVCAKCGSNDRVEVHHLRTVRDAPHLRLEPSNLQTLCKKHHSQQTLRDRGQS